MKNMITYRGFFRPVICLVLGIASLFLLVFDYPTIPCGKTLDMNKFELVWSDEFEGSEINEEFWSGHYTYGNATSTRKGGYWNKALASVSDGCLHISTKYLENGVNEGDPSGWYSYAMDTNRKYEQTYGYFETRCILPKGNGIWSAFWMLCDSMMTGDVIGGTDGAEIDVFESPFFSQTGIRKNAVSSNIHIDGYGEKHRSKNICTSLMLANDPYEEFNTYGVEWNEKGYTIYINGVKAGSSSFGGVSVVPEYLILSVEVGGENGEPRENWTNSIISENECPTDFVVDYVRAYSYK